jgi:hypothetical protein
MGYRMVAGRLLFLVPASTMAALGAYVVTRQFGWVFLLCVMLIISIILATGAAFCRAFSLGATCLGASVFVVFFVAWDIRVVRTRYRHLHDVDAFVEAGREAIRLSGELCREPMNGIEALQYRCDVTKAMAADGRGLAPLITVVVKSLNYKLALFTPRPGLRMFLVYSPDCDDSPCARVDERFDLYWCDHAVGANSPALGGDPSFARINLDR